MIKKILRWVLLGLLVALVIFQFMRPAKNDAPVTGDDFIARYRPPADVENMLRVGCYDCHSNQTRSPWYAEIQPVGWWLGEHITDAKREVNFSEFESFRVRRKFRKLEEMITQVEKGEMPLTSYRLIHSDAEFTPAQKAAFTSWVGAMRDSIKAATPPDSLSRPKPGS